MGQEIEKIAQKQGHEIGWIVDPLTANEFNLSELEKSDIAIDYSQPDSVTENILKCFEYKKPIIVGTTGWYDDFELIRSKCDKYNGTLFYATNFSIGVNILFKINDLLSKLMSQQTDYNLEICETHHTKKKDAPSGTAITLARNIIENIPEFEMWKTLEMGNEFKKENRKFPIFYSRKEGIIGEHLVKYKSEIEQICIEHKAFSRKGFVIGTLIAAEWVIKKKGIFTMSDMMQI